MAELAQSLLKHLNEIALKRRRRITEVTDPGHLRALLRARGGWPRHRPTNQRNEFPPLHRIFPSPSSDSGKIPGTNDNMRGQSNAASRPRFPALALFVRLPSAHADRSSCSRPKTLYGAIFVKGGSYPFFSSLRVSLFDLANRFFAPTHNRVEPARTEAVKDGRVARHPQGPWSLTGSSTTARLLASG